MLKIADSVVADLKRLYMSLGSGAPFLYTVALTVKVTHKPKCIR